MGRPPHCEPAQYTQPAKDRCDRFTLELLKQQAPTWKGRRAGGRDRRRRRSSEGGGHAPADVGAPHTQARCTMWVRPTHKPAARLSGLGNAQKWPGYCPYCSNFSLSHKVRHSFKFFTDNNEKTSEKSKRDVILNAVILRPWGWRPARGASPAVTAALTSPAW